MKCSIRGCNNEAVAGFGSLALCEYHVEVLGRQVEEKLAKLRESGKYGREVKSCLN